MAIPPFSNAPSRNIEITVGKMFGANFYTGNYASDDLALQAAINSVTTGFSGGAAIKIMRGTYDFVTGVTVGSTTHNLKIYGEGLSTILRWKNGNTFSNPSANANWLITTTSFCTITDLSFNGMSTFACPINGANTFSAQGSNIIGGGLLITDSRTWVDRVYITGMAEDGITSKGGQTTKYGEVEIIGCGGSGINLTNTANGSGLLATDNDLSSVWVGSCGTGITVAEGGTWIAGPHTWGCQGNGIYINADLVRVTGAYSETNAQWGIQLNGRTRCVIANCDIWSNGLAYAGAGTQYGGINLAGTSHRNIIVGNQLRDNRFNSAYLSGSSQENEVFGNTVSDSFGRDQTANTAITYTASGVEAANTTFTDANAPAWMSSSKAIGLTIVITGAGPAGSILTTQIVGWTNPTTVTLQDTMSTGTTNPAYSVHAVAYGIRETSGGSDGNNTITNNNINKLDAQIGLVVLNSVSGANSLSVNNAGVDTPAWYEAGNVASGAIIVDARNSTVYHATLTASVISVSFLPTDPNRNTNLTLIFSQDGTGSKTLTGWPGNIEFVGGNAPVLSTAASVTDIITLKYDGTNWIEVGRSIYGNSLTVNPMTTLGDLIYENATPTPTRLAGNITATKNFLTQTGTGTISAAPAWGTIAAGDVPTLNQNTSGTAAGLSATLVVGSGGTGQTSYTDGQLLIGNSSGSTLTKATITGTASQITVTNGNGSITLATPQSIATGSSPTFAGLSLGSGALNTVGNIEIDASANRDITVGRNASAGGNTLTIQAGGTVSGATNTGGGDLSLSSGITTGNARGNIKFLVANQGSTGTADNTPSQQASLYSVGSGSPTFAIGNTSNSNTGLPIASGNTLALNGNVAGQVQQYRHTTANTAGTILSVVAGSATSGATDKAGGDLKLMPGLSTGTGGANVRIQTMTRALSTGTGDNTATDRIIAQSPKSVTNASATTVASMTLANGTVVAGNLHYTVEVTDGTDFQYEAGVISYGVTNKAGAIANNTVTKFGNQQAATAGTLTVTWTITAANPALIQVNANSSLTPSTGYPRVTYVLENLTQQAVTIS